MELELHSANLWRHVRVSLVVEREIRRNAPNTSVSYCGPKCLKILVASLLLSRFSYGRLLDR